ncbi:hypothetical protein GCWU000282_01598 [Catonella morbi ATCC 51271]|jgi:hypothetical protein|uniref:Uncharacterized protein n=1 Tax=Catonella morbi ATCC 51271 TaxID=592026 RepID=V2Y185_9FIRM|nr:hypothetical protein [Catonella morbi]ESL02728.1 hypothetical protein GCWU000282_01598 [Catonella morbi ATCC 51271]
MGRDGNVMVWDSERQLFNELTPTEILSNLLSENSIECQLFMAWLPQVKSVFLYRRKRMEIVFIDGMTYNIPNMPFLYDKLFSMRHGA